MFRNTLVIDMGWPIMHAPLNIYKHMPMPYSQNKAVPCTIKCILTVTLLIMYVNKEIGFHYDSIFGGF